MKGLSFSEESSYSLKNDKFNTSILMSKNYKILKCIRLCISLESLSLNIKDEGSLEEKSTKAIRKKTGIYVLEVFRSFVSILFLLSVNCN